MISTTTTASDARTFTVGNHVAFNRGEYDPGSPAGKHVLAHELAHVRQQTGGAVSMLPDDGADLAIDPDPQLEREAEQTAQRVMAGGALGIQRLGDNEVHVQRMPDVDRLEAFREQLRSADEDENEAIPADPDVLANEVEQLKQGQKKLMAALSAAEPGAPTDGDWGKVATKGLVGSLAGTGAGAALGAVAGSVLPGLGTAVGAAAGAAFSGMANDLTKEGVEFMASNRPGGEGQRLERMYQDIREMYKELKEGSDTGSELAGIGKGGQV